MSNVTNDPTGGPSGDGWGVGLRVWVERAGRAVLGPEQLDVLEAIDRHGSLSAAAREMGLQYRRVWELVHGMNEAAGKPLVVSTVGGLQGGGASLTPLGRWAMVALRDSQQRLRQAAAGLAPRLVGGAGRPPLHVLAAVSLEEVLGRLLTDFAAVDPGQPVRAVFGASDELADHLLAGPLGHLFLTADPGQFERLRAARLLLAAPVVLAENGLAVIAPSGSRLAVRKAADLARRGLKVAVAGPDCPLGRYTKAYLDRFHVYESVLGRAVRVENSRSVLAAVRAGQADLGLVYASDAARADQCRTLLRVRQTPTPIRYGGSVLDRGAGEGAARRLLAFLASAPAAERFRQCGFLPARR
jgi:molybdenum ABC transporter molybdate-binding protein